MIGPDGRQLRLEMMYASPDAEQYLSPFAQMLRGIGIDASGCGSSTARNGASAWNSFDFDAMHVFVPMSDTPGKELNDAFGSEFADIPGSLNVGGVAKSRHRPADREDRDGRDARRPRGSHVRALDRVLRAMHDPGALLGPARGVDGATTTTTAIPIRCRPTGSAYRRSGGPIVEAARRSCAPPARSADTAERRQDRAATGPAPAPGGPG
jgi:hypothetical protein